MFIYAHLGQFSVRLSSRPEEYIVRAYTYVLVPGTLFRRATTQWVQMRQYDRSFPDTNYVGAYMDDLCARGRAIGPQFKSGNTVRNSPVVVRLFRNDEGTWVLERECKK